MAEICFGCFNPLKSAGACPNCGYDPAEDIGKYPSALRPATLLNGRYVLGRVMGQGGFGITYAAQDLKTGERVAVKEYFPAYMASREADGSISAFLNQASNFEHGKESFLEEANALVEFRNNPHIVNVYDLFQANGTVYFVMEFVQGRNLKSYVKIMGGRLGEEAANRILLPIMEALEEVHAKGLVHRDIAPDNIIVTAEGSAKLIDFGAARYSTGEKSLSLDVVLKHGYAPQEQYMRRGRQGPFTDVYAMAATYYYAVTGRVPPDAIERSAVDGLCTPSALGVRLSSHTEAALVKALRIKPTERFRSMAEFTAALKGKAPRRKRPYIVAAASVLMLVLAVAAGISGAFRPWRYDDKSATLSLRGKGEMEAVFSVTDGEYPWDKYSGKIKALVVGKGITNIGAAAFHYCKNLSEISLPEGITHIDNGAFYFCEALTEVKLPKGLTDIDAHAFSNCRAMTGMELPEGLKRIGQYAFEGCVSITDISLPKSLKTIEQYAFMGCAGLTEIVIPETVTSIEAGTFGDCTGLTQVTVSGWVKSIGRNAFSGCSALTEIVIPDMVTVIDYGAFSDCSALEWTVIPDSVTVIGDEAFSGCSAMKWASIPAGVTLIGKNAFSLCHSLEDIYYGGSQEQWETLGVQLEPGVRIHYNYTG